MKRPKYPRKVSKSRQVQMAEYAKLKRVFLEQARYCFKCADFIEPRYRDLHHFRGRTGRLLYFVPAFMMLCRKCHDWVHQHVKEAQRLGLIAGPAQWGRIPRDYHEECTPALARKLKTRIAKEMSPTIQ